MWKMLWTVSEAIWNCRRLQVDFFYMPASEYADAYLSLMSLSFATGLCIVVTNVVVQVPVSQWCVPGG